MINFFDRIYLLLALKAKEFRAQVIVATTLSVIIFAYSVIATYIGLYPLVNYYAVLVGIGLVFIFYFILWSNRLDVDWELLQSVEEAKKKASETLDGTEEEKEVKEVAKEIEEVTEEELPTNDEIQMIEDEEDVYDFGDPLEDLYSKGTPRQLADNAVNGTARKINEMLE